MPDRGVHVIVGGGLAGATAAAALREHGFDGRVVLVAAEAAPPYERPPLSKDYLRGESPLEKALVQPASFYDEHAIELLTGVDAVSLDPAAKRVALGDGRELRYDRLLLATGAVPRRPPIPGAELDGVQVLRTAADADALRQRLRDGAPLAVIGAGWIGTEVAASARQMGAGVTLADHAAAPLERVLGPQVGGWFARLHRERGVRLALGAGVERILGGRRVEAVALADGSRVEAGAVVLAVGVVPDVRLAQAAGLAVGDGVLVDEHLRTSAPEILAAGDIASVRSERHGRLRVEHWDAARAQGAAAARSMLGEGAPYERLPYFFSDQYESGMEYVGHHAPEDRLVVQGSLEEPSFRALWVDAEGRISAAMHVDDWDSMTELRGLVETRARAL